MVQLTYNVEDKPTTGKLIILALQQLLAIIAATITVPALIGLGDHMNAAILGAGVGTLAYVLITKRKSPVILSSSFAYIMALSLAAQGYGYLGICLGGIFSGMVYVAFSIIIKYVGSAWVKKIFQPTIIGPVVSLIGLSLAASAVANLIKADGYFYSDAGGATIFPYNLVAILCGLSALVVVVYCSVQKRNKGIQMTTFIFGILAGYVIAAFFSVFGYAFEVDYLKIIDFSPIASNFENITIASFISYPRFALLEGIKEIANGGVLLNGVGVAEIALAFIPVSLVSISEHIADHINLGSIIGRDLVNGEPGLSRTLMGDGVGNIVGTMFGICPNTTYGESIGCVAITRNASIRTIILAAFFCIALAFFTPLSRFLQTIPSCVMGGISLALYGYITVSGLKMIKQVDLDDNKNLYTVSIIFIAGLGGLALQIPYKIGVFDGTDFKGVIKVIEVGSIAFAMILGIGTNLWANWIEKRTTAAVEKKALKQAEESEPKETESKE